MQRSIVFTYSWRTRLKLALKLLRHGAIRVRLFGQQTHPQMKVEVGR